MLSQCHIIYVLFHFFVDDKQEAHEHKRRMSMLATCVSLVDSWCCANMPPVVPKMPASQRVQHASTSQKIYPAHSTHHLLTYNLCACACHAMSPIRRMRGTQKYQPLSRNERCRGFKSGEAGWEKKAPTEASHIITHFRPSRNLAIIRSLAIPYPPPLKVPIPPMWY